MSTVATAPFGNARQRAMLVAEQFETAEQQRAAASLGMWLFLATEVMFFGALFFGYAICRARFPDAFAAASRETDIVLGTANTAILLTSSVFVALAVHAAAARARKLAIVMLLIAVVLGAAFMGIKLTEYAHDYGKHLVPWLGFEFDRQHYVGARIFFSLYFATTGLHLVHLAIGIALVLALAWTIWKERANALADHVDTVALYWHFVDIVWIFLYPCLYLVSRS